MSSTLLSLTTPEVPLWTAIESGPLGQVRAYYMAAVFELKKRVGQGALEHAEYFQIFFLSVNISGMSDANEHTSPKASTRRRIPELLRRPINQR